MFINKWHLLEDFNPCIKDDVFFFAPESGVYAGRYMGDHFEMADGSKIKESTVKAWRYVNPYGNKDRYPVNGERIAISLKEGVFTGIYNDQQGKLGVVEVDPVYTGEDYNIENSVDFCDCKDKWSEVPEAPTTEMYADNSVDGTSETHWKAMEIEPEDVNIENFPGKNVEGNEPVNDSTLEAEMGQVTPTLETDAQTETEVGEIKVDPNTGIPEHDTWSAVSYNGTIKNYD